MNCNCHYFDYMYISCIYTCTMNAILIGLYIGSSNARRMHDDDGLPGRSCPNLC